MDCPLDTISQQNFGQSAQSVLTFTPRTKLMVNPGRTERQNQKRTVVKEVKECIQNTMNENSITSVMANRITGYMGAHGEGTWVYMVEVHGCTW